jgi:hypothetical protein
MKKLSLLIVVCLIAFSFQQVPFGCLIWRNSYVSFSKENNNIISVNVKSRQKNGWMAIAAVDKPENFENSLMVLSYFPNHIIQLNNHSNKIEIKKTIFQEYFDNTVSNQIDGILSFRFKINSSEISEKHYFYFAQNDFTSPIKTNQSYEFPKHNRFSEPYLFLLNNTKEPLECNFELTFPGRFSAWSIEAFLPTCLFYFLIFILLLTFRNHQPLKSRFIGPFILLFGMYTNLLGEFLFILVTYEVSNKLYCYVVGFILYLAFQLA